MVREKIKISTQRPQWKCVDSRREGQCLYYGRFILSPLLKGQADTIGIGMRRVLLGEMEGTCITRAKFEKIRHEFAPLFGIKESVQEILMNLKEIVLRGNPYGTQQGLICVNGPGDVTAKDIILPPSLTIVDKTQHICTLIEPISFCLDLAIERGRGYGIKTTKNLNEGSYPIDAVFMPVRNTNHSIHSYGNGNPKQELLFLEIWTNGSLTPQEALQEAARNLINLFIPFLDAEEETKKETKKEIKRKGSMERDEVKLTLPADFFLSFTDSALRHLLPVNEERKRKNQIAVDVIFIDQLELPPRIFNCLKKSNIHTLGDLSDKSEEDLLKIEHLRSEDVQIILDIKEREVAKFLEFYFQKEK